MSDLFNNAVASIRMGVEDYTNKDGNRALSAVRNFYSGVLLLAKEVLVRTTPEARMQDVLAATYKPQTARTRPTLISKVAAPCVAIRSRAVRAFGVAHH